MCKKWVIVLIALLSLGLPFNLEAQPISGEDPKVIPQGKGDPTAPDPELQRMKAQQGAMGQNKPPPGPSPNQIIDGPYADETGEEIPVVYDLPDVKDVIENPIV